jgi:hypothetical protein
MKNRILLAAGLVLLQSVFASHTAWGQSPAVSAVSVQLGGRAVRIPTPDKFTDSMLHFPRIASRLIAAESPGNEVLAVHVTDEIVPVLRNGEEPDVPFYTKVSVFKELKGVEVEPWDYNALVSDFEKQSPGALQAVVKKAEKDMGERLNDFWGSDAGLRIGETRMLGYFDKQPQSISSMFLMNIEQFNRKVIILGSMSLLYVNKRVLFLYVFRIPTGTGDQEKVEGVTRSWTAKTIAANR